MITQTLKSSNFSRNKASVIELLNQTRENVEASAEIFKSSEGKIQIFRTVSALLLQKEAYDQLVEYLDETILDFETNKLFSNDTHSIRLLMRIWLIISLFKVYRLERAAGELVILEKEMKMYGKQNYFTYLFNYYNIKINLLKAQGKLPAAAKLIREALAQKEIRNRGDNHIFLLRSLADHQFNSQRFQDAVGTLARLKAEPAYKKMDDEIRMFVEIFEMITHLEAGDLSHIPNSFKLFKRSFRATLKSEEHIGTKKFLDILVRMNTSLAEGKKLSLKMALKSYKALVSESEYGDNQIVMYDLYLQARLEDRPYYDLFLDNIRQKSPD